MRTGLPKSIALVAGAELAFFNMALAEELKRRVGCKVWLYTQGVESVRSHERFKTQGCVDEIIDWDVLHRAALTEGLDADAVFARARTWESTIGCTYNQLIMGHRDVGHGFALAGFYHPRSHYSDRLSYVQTVHGLNELLAFWQREIETRKLDLIIGGVKEAPVMARAAKLPFRMLYSARVENRYYWARSEFAEFPGLEEAFDALAGHEFPPVNLSQPYHQETKHRARIVGGSQVLKLIRKLLVQGCRHAYLTLKGYRSKRSYYYTSMARFYLRYYLDIRKLRPPHAKPLAGMRGKRFVFFPLQTEPELSLQVMSPEYFCQLSALASIARDLPAGIVLAVKDTIHGVGRRPRDFYDQIRDLKNVVLLDVFEQGIEIIRHADAVVTISGSAGLEAAMMGKPVMLMGRHNHYEFLPHVTLVTREEALRPALDAALNGSIDADRARADGARLREALMRISFDMRDYTNVDLNSYDDQTVANAADALLASLEDTRTIAA